MAEKCGAISSRRRKKRTPPWNESGTPLLVTYHSAHPALRLPDSVEATEAGLIDELGISYAIGRESELEGNGRKND
jgi:hypothetical protein